METAVLGITAPSAVYELAGRRFDIGTRGFAEAVADSHAARPRPRCMCLVEGIEMYVARLGDGYIVKRMPDTGSHHHASCLSYEPDSQQSGLGELIGEAVLETAMGGVDLRVDFPRTRTTGRGVSRGESDM